MIRVMLFAIYAMVGFGVLCVIYVIVPVLIPFLVVIGGLAILTWGIVTASRFLERKVQGQSSDEHSQPDV